MSRKSTAGQKMIRNNTPHCDYCDRKLYRAGKFKATIEHFYPYSADKKHLNAAWNKVVICKRCNNDKGSKMPEEYVKELRRNLGNYVSGSEFHTDCLDMIINISQLVEKLKWYYLIREML